MLAEPTSEHLESMNIISGRTGVSLHREGGTPVAKTAPPPAMAKFEGLKGHFGECGLEGLQPKTSNAFWLSVGDALDQRHFG